MIGFRLTTDKLLQQSYTSEMWCAAYIINGGCSDDGFEYFRNWVISRGREVYYKAKENPDNLISQVISGQTEFEFEGFCYVPITAFRNRTGENLYDYIDFGKFTDEGGGLPQMEFNWQEDDPESMRKVCPKLFEELWR